VKIIIAGGGRAGLSVAAHLSGTGHDVTLIDRDPAVARVAFETHGIVSLAGDATEPRLMAEAEVDRVDVVVGMLPRDADNLAVAALSRRAGAKRIMVRVKDDAYRALYVAFGVDRIVSEIEVFIGAIATAIEHESVRASMLLGNGDSIAFELALPADSWLDGMSVSEIASAEGFPSSCVMAGVHLHDGPIEAPRGQSTVHAGATLLLVSRRNELAAAIDFFLRPGS
jgi:trk system potassium uptake protein TrkA